MGVLEKITGNFNELIKKLTLMQKRQLILVCTAVFALVLTFSVIMSIVNRMEKPLPQAPERTSIRVVIPADELFLPEEPDYLPGVLLDRERRESWSEEDAAEFWQDPLREGEEAWRQKIEAEIDELMERVP